MRLPVSSRSRRSLKEGLCAGVLDWVIESACGPDFPENANPCAGKVKQDLNGRRMAGDVRRGSESQPDGPRLNLFTNPIANFFNRHKGRRMNGQRAAKDNKSRWATHERRFP